MIRPTSGQTSFCLDRFSQSAGVDFAGRNNSRDKQKIRRQVCRLLGIGSSAGRSWFVLGIMPNGLRLIRLRYILELVGYTLYETRHLTAEQRSLANHLALSAFSVEHVAEFLGVSRDTVMSWATGRFPPSKSHAREIKELLKPSRVYAGKERKLWRRTLRSLNLIPGPKTRSREESVFSTSSVDVPADVGEPVESGIPAS